MINVCHIADVHFRGLSRHAEYKVVFERLVASCKQRNIDHVFIGGDIFHTKTSGISPEYIDLLTWFLRTLASVGTLHITLGNHDGNLTNLSRQDSVSPIVEALSHEFGESVRLHKDSGVYELAPGFSLCVFSCFDEPGWKHVRPKPGDVNIASFHGPVSGATTDDGWNLEGHVDVGFFKDYDFVFLGDIHKQQSLASRACADGVERTWIAYPGSTIQQNFGEAEVHGYLHWSISDRDHYNVEFVPIENPCPFVTIPWTPDMPVLSAVVRSRAPGARYRVSGIPRDESHNASYVTKLMSEAGASEVTFQWETSPASLATGVSPDDDVIRLGETDVLKQDLRRPGSMFEMLKLAYGHRHELSEDSWASISSRVEAYLKDVTSDEETRRGSGWTLHNLRFDNTFSYGSNNEVDFSRMRGTVGIFGANRQGKSSIVGTLMYCLYNGTDRGNFKNLHVINTRQEHCYAAACIEVDSKFYAVERQTVKHQNKKGVVNTVTNLNLSESKDMGDSLIDMNGEQRADTEKPLRMLIGCEDDFSLTAVASQNDVAGFIELGPTQRKRIVSRFIDVDVFDKLYEACNDDMKKLKAVLKSFGDTSIQETLDRSRGELATKLSERETQNLAHENLKHELVRLKAELRLIDTRDNDKLEHLRNDVRLKKLKLDHLSQQVDAKQAEVSQLQTKITNLRAKLETIDVSELRAKLASIRTSENLVRSLKESVTSKAAVVSRIKKNVELLNSVPCGTTFPTCKFIASANGDRDKLADASEEHERLVSQLADARKVLERLQSEKVETKISAFETGERALASSEEQVRLLTTQLEPMIVKMNELSAESETLNASLTRAELQHGDDAAGASKAEKLLHTAISRCEGDVSAASGKLYSLAASIGKLEGQIELFEENLLKRASIVREMEELSVIHAGFSKRGLPSIIVAQQLPRINAELARLLAGIADFSCEMEIVDDDLHVYMRDGDERHIIELCSGMEKVICSLAVRIALVNVTTLPKPDFFIIDEGFGALDPEGIVMCGRLLETMKRSFRFIIVISHVEAIKDMVDSYVMVSRDDQKVSHVDGFGEVER